MNKINQKFTENELKAIELVRQNPAASDYKISKELQQQGYITTDTYLSDRLRNKVELRETITKYREKNLEKLHKDITPEALAILEEAVKSSKISKKNKFRWVKLALDKSFVEVNQQGMYSPTQININEMRVYLQNRTEKLGKGDKEEDDKIDSLQVSEIITS